MKQVISGMWCGKTLCFYCLKIVCCNKSLKQIYLVQTGMWMINSRFLQHQLDDGYVERKEIIIKWKSPDIEDRPWIFSYFLLCFRDVRPSVCTSVRPILVNAKSQERLEGISSNLAQTSTWIQGWTDYNLVVKGQRSLWPRKTHFWPQLKTQWITTFHTNIFYYVFTSWLKECDNVGVHARGLLKTNIIY